MRICITNRKKGFASLEVIAMALIGFVVTLALLSIALNKRVLLQSEIKTYEGKLNMDNERNEFLSKVVYLINSTYEENYLKESNEENGIMAIENYSIGEFSDLKSNIESISSEELNFISEELNEENILENTELDLKWLLYISEFKLKDDKFNLYLDEKNNIFVLEETLDGNEKSTYYYDYRFKDKEMFLKERSGYGIK